MYTCLMHLEIRWCGAWVSSNLFTPENINPEPTGTGASLKIRHHRSNRKPNLKRREAALRMRQSLSAMGVRDRTRDRQTEPRALAKTLP